MPHSDAAHSSRFKSLNSKISVRSRIVAIAVIPVIGFLTNGIAFTAGETDVEVAFRSVKQAADARRRERGVQGRARGHADRDAGFRRGSEPGSDRGLRGRQRQASQSLDTIETSVGEDERYRHCRRSTAASAAVQDNFLTVKKEQEILGFTETEGIRGRLDRAGAAVETIIDQELTWVAEEDARKLMISLLTMRRYEAEYRLNQRTGDRWQFVDEIAHFNALFDSVDGAPEHARAADRPGSSLCRHVRPMGQRRREGRAP